MQKICWILSVNRDGATLFVGSPAYAGPWLFSNKEQQNIKAFFQPTYEIDFISYDVLSEEVPEAAFILYNEMLAPYLPEKITKVGQPIAYVDIATKNYEQFKKALVAKSSQE